MYEERLRKLLECLDTKGIPQIRKRKFDYIHTINEPYLNEINTRDVLRELKANNYKANLLVRSGHGTAKTTGLALLIIKAMEQH